MTISVAPQNHDDDKKGPNARRCIGRTVVLLIAVGGVSCSMLAVLSCDFFELIATADYDTMSIDFSGISNIGLFSFQLDDGTCHPYYDADTRYFPQPNDTISTMWQIAQYAAFIAPSLGIFAFTFSFLELICGRFIGSFLIPSSLFLLACACQAVTFFTYNEDDVCFQTDGGVDADYVVSNSCQLSFGAFLAIAAGFCYYICSVLLCFLPRPLRRCTCCCDRRVKLNSPDSTDQRGTNGDDKTMTVADTSVGSDVENPR